MFHSGTTALIDAWSVLPGAERIPARSAFDPMVFGSLVPYLWSADHLQSGRTRIRLAGSWIERLHGRGLASADWLALWRSDSRPAVAAAIAVAFRQSRPVVLSAGSPMLAGNIEVSLLPMRDRTGSASRIIGLYQPLHLDDRKAEAIGELLVSPGFATTQRHQPTLSLATLDGRRIA
jgi:hypothetical protein